MRYRILNVQRIEDYLANLEVMAGASTITNWKFHSALPSLIEDGKIVGWKVIMEAESGSKWLDEIFSDEENLEWLTEKMNKKKTK